MTIDPAVSTTELLAPWPATALEALLETGARAGDELPPLWHWVYLLDHVPESELGPDGHATNGIPSPPAPNQSRMFAGGRVVMNRPLMLGRTATRRSSVLSTTKKVGRSGPLTFITVRHEFVQDDVVAIAEELDLVYRPGSRRLNAPTPAVPPTASAPVPDFGFDFAVDPIVLFRFSALTFNSHRIHYDRPFAVGEGYPDLVIHGPLQVVLMAEAMRQAGISLLGRQFSFRLLAPAFGTQQLRVDAFTNRAPGQPENVVASAYVRDSAGLTTARSTLEAPDSTL